LPGNDQNWARDEVNAYAHVGLMKGGSAAASPGAGVHIGILDTGIDLNHSDFTGVGVGSLALQDGAGAAEQPFFSPSHGTSVASAAVGLTSGIAWGAEMFPKQVVQRTDTVRTKGESFSP